MSPNKLATLQSLAQAAEKNVQLAKSREEALEAAITAAETYMRALKLTTIAADQQNLDQKCKKCIDTAEKIKTEVDWKSVVNEQPAPVDAFSKKPKSSRKLTTKEQIIILEGSKVNGFIFPPWKENPKLGDFALSKDSTQYEESQRLALSNEQQQMFGGWKRPSEAFAGIDARGEPIKPSMTRPGTCDLVQDATTDCSIVASLCAGTARAERGHPKLLSTIIYPYDHGAKHPAMSPSGKYILRLNFNGCDRMVTIDDYLPTSSSRTLHVVDRQNPGLIWPALVEKAYLKIRGGYDFPGSNSATDLVILTGWIPEQIFLHDNKDLLPSELWKKIFNAFSHGDILVTIGTGVLSLREQKQLGLVGQHDYAVIDMRENDGFCEMLIKNPWSDGGVWKGNRPQSMIVNKIPENIDPSDASWAPLTPGTFWMDLRSVFQHFENLYINWNPGLFTHREDIHFSWDLSQDSNLPGYLGVNPQFSVSVAKSGPVWILLSKHFKDGEHTSNTSYRRGYISLYLFAAGGQQVFLSDGAVERGPFVDSPNTLLKVDMQKDTPYTVVIASQSLPPSKYNFTLSAYARSPIVLSRATARYQHSVSKSAFWTRSTAGGNSDSPVYLQNPQFSLSLSTPSSVSLLLSTDSSDVAVHAKLFFVSTNPASVGQRILTIRSRDVLAHTGDYRRSCAVTETQLAAGLYTIICSTFEPNQLCKFTLAVSSTSSGLQLRTLSSEASGRLSTLSTPAVFPGGVDRMLAPLVTRRLVRARFIARYLPPNTNSTSGASRSAKVSNVPLKISLELGQGPYKEVIATSAALDKEFSDEISGVRIPDLDLRPEWCISEGLWLVVERMGGGRDDNGQDENKSSRPAEGGVEVEVLGEERVEIGQWGTGDG